MTQSRYAEPAEYDVTPASNQRFHLSPQAPLLIAAGLATGPVVALGFGRFAYALLLPPMQTALNWSYVQAGAMNTANGLGYLLGAVLAPVLMRWSGVRAAFMVSLLGIALTLALTALSGELRWLAAMRFLTGLGGAVTFTSGGLLVAQVASAAPPQRAGAVLSLFYAGAGLGILLTGLGLPPLLAHLGADGWRAGWLGLGLVSFLGLGVAWTAARHTAAQLHGSAAIRMAQLWPLRSSLIAYACAGLGYVAYTTFSISYLRSQGASTPLITLFWALLGLAGVLAPLVWSRLLSRRWGGRSMGILMLLMGTGAALPVLSTLPWVAALSAVLFGLTALSVVASTTTLVRQSLPAAVWGAGVATYTVTFAAFQSLGPLLTGALADTGTGGLRWGLGASAVLLMVGAGVAFSQRVVGDHG
nr:YbfB/YjiJ family MFS transporter [Deinococcus humi]